MGDREEIIKEYIKEEKAKKERKVKAQKDAEIEAEGILEQKGFKKIFRFDSVWFLRMHHIIFDCYAEKDGRWGIRITSGKKKKPFDDAYSRKFRGFRVGHLHKNDNGEWEFNEAK